MKAKNRLTKHDMKIFQRYPLIGHHQIAANMLEAIIMCRKGIKICEAEIDTLLKDEPAIVEEFYDTLDAIASHIIFCETALYEAKSTLNKISYHLN
jgi:hypothetical protein